MGTMLSLALSSRRLRACLLAGIAVLALGGSARAAITPLAEPAYTKTATTDVFAWHWQAVNGLNLDTNQTTYLWWTCLKTYREGVLVETSNGTQGWNSPNCWLQRSSSTGPSSGTSFTWPFATSTVLDDGARYQMCLTGYNIYGYYNSYPSTALLWDNQPTACNASTIDRNQPSIGVSIDGTTEVTNNPQFALQIDYSDPTSPPWFGSDGRASNWTCWSRDTNCVPQALDPACSLPANKYARITSFACQRDMTAQPDGAWRFCVRSADAAVPDNPSSADQFAGATSDKANVSGIACGYVTLDRQPPTVAARASAVDVTVGQLLDLTASASDPNGLKPGFDWDFGDNTPHGTGASTTHTYTQPGTFQAKVTAADLAGNSGTGTVTITVRPAGTPTTPPGAPTPAPTATPTPTNQPGTGVTPLSQPVSTSTVSAQAGGGGAQNSTVAGLSVIAPKRFVAGKRTTILLALTAPGPGTLKVTLRKGSKRIVERGAVFAAAGPYSMKLKVSRALKAGRYTLRIAFTPSGGAQVTKSLKLTVVRTRGTGSAAPARSPGAARLRGTPVDRLAHDRARMTQARP